MTIANQPHAVAYYSFDKELQVCYAFGEHGAIEDRFAVFADRAAADAAVKYWNSGARGGPVYFVVPAEAVFPDRYGQPDPNGPLTSEQRRALFAAFTDVFGDRDNERRYAFTRLALCKAADEPVSWSAHGNGRLTYAEASQVLDALDMLSV